MKREMRIVVWALMVVCLCLGVSALARPVKVDKDKVKVERVRKGADVVVQKYLYDTNGAKVLIESVEYVPGRLQHEVRVALKELRKWQAIAVDPVAYAAAKIAAAEKTLADLAEIANTKAVVVEPVVPVE